MTEQEWAIVTTALTDLFDTVKLIAPERININKMYMAGRILQMEQDRIRARQYFTGAGAITGTRGPNWQKRNEELEKKKEAQRAQDMNDLSDTLKQSIEKINHERKEEK
jgi:hypothetical protein